MTKPIGRPDPRHLLVASRVRRLEGAEPPHLDPSLMRVRRGYFRPAGIELSSGDDYRMRILATADARADGLIFTHASAAELWGCPQLRADQAYVHVTRPGSARRTTAGVKVHRGAISSEHVVETGGLLISSPEWTAVQVAATQPLPNALLALDHLLRLIAGRTGRAPADIIDLLVDLIPERMKGCRHAERHLRLADPRADSAGESLSRGQMVLLGVPMPDLQTHFPRGDQPGDDVVDFDWPELGVFGEFDGRAKYFSPEFAAGRTPAEVVLDEKRREDRIRRHRPRGVRWGWADALSRRRLAGLLAAGGVLPHGAGMTKLSP